MSIPTPPPTDIKPELDKRDVVADQPLEQAIESEGTIRVSEDILPLPELTPQQAGIIPHQPPLADPDDQPSVATLSQWQLIRRRFAKHKLAVASFYLLIILYFLAIFAEFFAPYTNSWKDVQMTYCPPQPILFNFERGLHTEKLQRVIEPITAQNYFINTGETIPLGFFVKGDPYVMWGLIPMDRHFFGVSNYKASASQHGNTFYLLGADKYGRDLWSRLVYGARISLSIGLVSIIVTFVLGAIIGGISGYVGGGVDTFIQRVIEVINSFPHLPLWLAFAAVMPSSWSPIQTYFAITIVLSLLGWTGLARVVRGKILSLREEDYAVAARLLGASHSRVIFLHLLPGFSSHIIVSLSMGVPGMILGETALSFLGLGLRPPVVSWGVMLQDCLNLDVVANYPWLLMPVVMIILTVLAFNFFGDGMRDAADPYASR
ncbi:MAG: ABC transporter permease [Candidatus Methylacidiphilales bacterium]|nr:ABC transporter permease [Candidatus Methylacidiphilales bacterium]